MRDQFNHSYENLKLRVDMFTTTAKRKLMNYQNSQQLIIQQADPVSIELTGTPVGLSEGEVLFYQLSQ